MPTVTEIIEARSANIEAGGSGSEGIQRRYSRQFRVWMDSWADSSLRVVICEGIPRIGDVYSVGGTTDTGARCHRVDPQATEEPRQWTVTVEYSTSPNDIGDMLKEAGTSADPNNPADNSGDQGQGGGPGGSQANNPLAKPAQIVWGVERYTVAAQKAYKDVDSGIQNVAVASAAGEPFDPPVEIDAGRLTLTITRNEPTFSQVTATLFQDRVNSDQFFEIGAGKVKCNGITGQSQEENGVQFWVVTYSFSIRLDGWYLVVLNQGFYEISGGNRVRIVDSNGDPVSAPVPLNAAGAKLTVAQVQAGSFTYRTFQVYEEREFSVLNLP